MRRRLLALASAGAFFFVMAAADTAAAFVSTGDGSWVWQSPLPQGNRINDVHVFNADHLLAVGDHGLLLESDDGGTTWQRREWNIDATLNAVAFANASTGVIVGDHGLVLRTTNGGANWLLTFPSTTQDLRDVCFANALQGWAVGSGGVVLYTDNAGSSWETQTTPVNKLLRSVHFSDASHGWAVGSEGTIIATSQGGAPWTQQASGTTRDLFDVCSETTGSTTNLWVVGTWTIRRTTNGGTTWSPVTLPPGHGNVTYKAVDAPWSGYVAVAATGDDYNWNQSGGIWLTGDGGANWTTAFEGRFAALECLGHDPAGTVAWAGGGGGLLLNSLAATPTSWNWHAGATLPSLAAIARCGEMMWAVGPGTLLLWDGSVWRPSGAVSLSKTPHDVTFFDDTHGWIADSAWVWRTNDGGRTWTKSPTLPFSALDLDFVSPRVGTAVGTSSTAPTEGRVFRTLDGGDTWTDVTPTPTPATLTAVDMVDATHGFAVGATGTVLRTTDGSNWTALPSGTTEYLTDVCFTSVSQGWIVSSGGSVLATKDAGENFNAKAVSSRGLYAIDFQDADHGWASGSMGTILRYDGVSGTWSPVTSGTVNGLNDIMFTDPLHGWAVGTDGTVLATTTGGVPDILPPVTTVSGVPAGWRNRDVVLSFSAVDPGGSGVVATHHKVDDGAWSQGTTCIVGAPADNSNDGTHTVAFYSVDAFGNEEAEKTCTVSIDTRKPRPRAPYVARVTRGRTATLRYRIDDTAPCAGTARPVVKITKLGGRLVKTLKPAAQPVGKWRTLRLTCKLARGTYRFTVYATDAAGNRQAKTASNKLVVR
ncbi:MAG: YCF48-related protein [Acidobacteriota bacterium]|nr:YCF48-related protein [Acidobacteriota bacterium]